MEVHWYVFPAIAIPCVFTSPLGNYDITKMHYDGPGAVPGSLGSGYGYDVRTNNQLAVLPKPVTA